MNSLGLITAATLSVFVATAAGNVVANKLTAPTSVSTQTSATNPTTQTQPTPVNTGLLPADYFAAGMACGSYTGNDVPKDPNRMIKMLDGSYKPASQVYGQKPEAQQKADAARDGMFAAAIKAAGVDPASCLK